MKKSILSILLTIFFSSSYAQAPIGFYLKAGGNSASLETTDFIAESALGYNAGLIFNMGYHETFSYQFELTANRNNFSFKTVEQNFAIANDTKMSFTSTNIGLFFNYYILKPEEDAFYFGPQVGLNFLVAPKLEQVNPSEDSVYYLPYLLTDNDFEMPDFMTNVGVGFTGGYNNFRFDFRYEIGLSNMLENVLIENPQRSYEAKINTLSFGISYLIISTRKK